MPYFYNDDDELKYDNTLPVIPELITKFLPEVKIIICLRDPVDRAISHFGLWLGKGVISPFSNLKRLSIDKKKLRIVEYGHYAKYLELWKNYVPPERMHIIIFEDDILISPNSTITNVFKFLGVDSNITPNKLDKKVNKTNGWSRIFISYFISSRLSRVTHKKPFKYIFDLLDKTKLFNPLEVSDEDKGYLRSIFISEKPKIEKLLNRNLNNWKYGKKN